MKPTLSNTTIIVLAIAGLGVLLLTLLALRGPDSAGQPAGPAAVSAAGASAPTAGPVPMRTAVAQRQEVTKVREEYRAALAAESRPPDGSPAVATAPDSGSTSGASTAQAPDAASSQAAGAVANALASGGAPIRPVSGLVPGIPPVTPPAQAAAGSLPAEDGSALVPVTEETRLWLPAAMLEPDETISITTELQVAEWERLQDLFVEAVDGRNPGDQASREVWVRAQEDNDERFRQKFGWDAFQAQQMKAYREGLAPNN
jgi:hypothetical protein